MNGQIFSFTELPGTLFKRNCGYSTITPGIENFHITEPGICPVL